MVPHFPCSARASSGDLFAWLVGLLTWHPKTPRVIAVRKWSGQMGGVLLLLRLLVEEPTAYSQIKEGDTACLLLRGVAGSLYLL